MTLSELADRLGIAPATASLMVGQLSRGGLIKRREDEHDRRRTIPSIAPPAAAQSTAGCRAEQIRWAEHSNSCPHATAASSLKR
jgi:hypothetical protein